MPQLAEVVAVVGQGSPDREPRRPGAGTGSRSWIERLLDPVRWEPGHERLAALPVFVGCSRSDIRVLARSGDECFVPAGTVLCREGRIGYWLFVVTSGAVQLRRGADGAGVAATLRSGSHFGEVAIIGFGPQPVSAVVVEDARVFVLGRRYVLDLVHSMPAFRAGLFPGVSSEAELGGVVRELRSAGTAAWSSMPREAVGEMLAGDRIEQLPRSLVAVPTRVRTMDGAIGGSPFAAALAGGSDTAGRSMAVPAPIDRRVLAAMAALVVVALVVFGCLFHPDVVVVRPSAAIDVSGDVEVVGGGGAALRPARGRYVLTAVDIEETNLFGLAAARLRGEEILRRAHGDTAASDARTGRASYRRSQSLAVELVGARAAGLGLDPASVRIRDRGLVGPSAGLLYALVLADMSGVVDVPAGRVVAATGELDRDGRVLGVSFVSVKQQVARGSGATVFVVPSSAGLPRRAGTVGAATLDEALAAIGS